MLGSNYRNILIEMLLNIRIRSPSKFENMTIGQRLGSINWKARQTGLAVQDALYFGNHNSVCLAHGRVPLIPVRDKFVQMLKWVSYKFYYLQLVFCYSYLELTYLSF